MLFVVGIVPGLVIISLLLGCSVVDIVYLLFVCCCLLCFPSPSLPLFPLLVSTSHPQSSRSSSQHQPSQEQLHRIQCMASEEKGREAAVATLRLCCRRSLLWPFAADQVVSSCAEDHLHAADGEGNSVHGACGAEEESRDWPIIQQCVQHLGQTR